MSEWRLVRFGAVTKNFDSVRFPVRAGDRKKGPYPYYGASGVVDHVSDYLFDGDYLLIAEDGENLRSRKTPVAFTASGKFWVNNHAHIVQGNEDVNTKFLRYSLAETDISGYLSGSTQPKLTQVALNSIVLCLPSREIQDSIVEILGSLDNKIAVNERIAATALELARCIYSSFAAGAYAYSELGKLVTFKYGKALRAPDRREGTTPVYGCTGQVGWHDTSLTLGPTPVVGRKGANAGWVSWSPKPCWVIDTAFFAETKVGFLSPEVAFLMLETANLPGFVGDSAVPGLNREVAHSLLVKVPEPETAAEVSERVRPLLARAIQAEQESGTLADLRDTLLPQFMFGQLRVRDVERVVEVAL